MGFLFVPHFLGSSALFRPAEIGAYPKLRDGRGGLRAGTLASAPAREQSAGEFVNSTISVIYEDAPGGAPRVASARAAGRGEFGLRKSGEEREPGPAYSERELPGTIDGPRPPKFDSPQNDHCRKAPLLESRSAARKRLANPSCRPLETERPWRGRLAGFQCPSMWRSPERLCCRSGSSPTLRPAPPDGPHSARASHFYLERHRPPTADGRLVPRPIGPLAGRGGARDRPRTANEASSARSGHGSRERSGGIGRELAGPARW